MDWRDIPSLSALRAFEAAARLQSFSAAARELNVTHAAIAQHVRSLETHFGQALLERAGRGMVPTAAGRQLAGDLNAGFAEIGAGVRSLMQAKGAQPISLTTTVTFAENWLMPRIAKFWSAHPDIPVTIAADNRVHDLRREGHDFAIRYGSGKWPGLEARYLANALSLVVACPSVAARLPKEYSASSPDAATQLAALPWLTHRGYGELESWIRAQGLKPDCLNSTELETNSLVLAACRAGAGVSLQSYAVVERDIESGALVALLEQPEEEDLGYYLLNTPGVATPRAKTLSRWLLAQV